MDKCICVTCGACDGTGHIYVDMRGRYIGRHASDDMDEMVSCPACDGSGITEECDYCLDRANDFDPYEAAGESPFGLPGGGSL